MKLLDDELLSEYIRDARVMLQDPHSFVWDRECEELDQLLATILKIVESDNLDWLYGENSGLI